MSKHIDLVAKLREIFQIEHPDLDFGIYRMLSTRAAEIDAHLEQHLAINPADSEHDVVYINGDHNITTVLTQTAEHGGATRALKLRQIEPEFLERMFSTEAV